MSVTDFFIGISGLAGEGIVTAGKIISHLFARTEYHLFKFDDYSAEIRGGGKSSTFIRISTEERRSPRDFADLMILTSDKYLTEDRHYINSSTVVIYDSSTMDNPDTEGKKFGIPFDRILKNSGAGSRNKNILLLSLVQFFFNIEENEIKSTFASYFGHKTESFIRNIIHAYDTISEQVRSFLKTEPFQMKVQFTQDESTGQILDGNTALALGAIDADIQLYAGYPITPATPIMERMAKELPPRGKIYLQMEDEIASISAVIGSWFGGNRAMTATSGPGLSLMIEMLNFSFMSEIPCVIVDVQRAGPATGMPTKTEQSDLLLSVFGGAGDFQRIVLAPTTIADCYESMHFAFNLAEKYQLPVIVLSDLFLSYHQEKVILNRRISQNGDSRQKPYESGTDYKRYALTESGVSPWEIPGEGMVPYTVTGLEHDEIGNSNYTSENHSVMTKKRLRKIKHACHELPEPVTLGNPNARFGIIAWGSMVPIAEEFVEKNPDFKLSYSTCLNPFDRNHFQKFADGCDKIIVPEVNQTGQFSAYLRSHIEHQNIFHVPVPSGKPISVGFFESLLKERING